MSKYIIKPHERGHRKKKYPGVEMGKYTIYTRKDLCEKAKKIGNDKLSEMIENYEE